MKKWERWDLMDMQLTEAGRVKRRRAKHIDTYHQHSRLAPKLIWKEDDGGRSQSTFSGRCSDCVVRAIAVATCPIGAHRGQWYKDIYNLIALTKKELGLKASARNGSPAFVYGSILEHFGYREQPYTHETLRDEHVCIMRMKGHIATVIGNKLHDAYDSRSKFSNNQLWLWIYRPTWARDWRDVADPNRKHGLPKLTKLFEKVDYQLKAYQKLLK